ncbi:MAG TPA: PTS sugar transporter subunit IIC [Longimicrobiales bacterium]|nr:PTS sugar transporter subunit IIC [Longimicrobiales bacterium]
MNWLAVALLGGIVGLDSTAFGQVMLSRPLVAGTLTGLVLGRPLAGLAVGLALEVFALVILPVGAARYPEVATGAVASAAAYVDATGYGAPEPLLLLAIAFGLVWENVAGQSVILIRHQNERLVAGDRTLNSLTARSLERRHLTAMSLDFARGAVVSLVGALVGSVLLRTVAPYWALGSAVALGIIVVGGSGMVGATLPLFGGWSERRAAFVVGIACGLLILLFA